MHDATRTERRIRYYCQEARDSLEDARAFRAAGETQLAALSLRLAVRATQEAVDYHRWDFRVQWIPTAPRRQAGTCARCGRDGVVLREHYSECVACMLGCDLTFCSRHHPEPRNHIA